MIRAFIQLRSQPCSSFQNDFDENFCFDLCSQPSRTLSQADLYLMTSLDLHNRLFTSESDKHAAVAVNQRLLSLSTAQEPSNPTSLTFNSPAYLDLLSRQPLHPDGPRHWDFGLDLTGDPATVAECKSLEGRATKAKLRRLQTICVVFEVVLGILYA